MSSSELQSVTPAEDFDYVCPRCTRQGEGILVRTDDSIVVDPAASEVVEEVESFCYLGCIVD